jgi:phage gp29-like protein
MSPNPPLRCLDQPIQAFNLDYPMNLKTFAAEVRGMIGLPVTASHRPPSPRSDPPNALATAKASDLASATRAAEQGDTKQLFTLYRDFVLSDDHVQSCLNTRKLAVLGQPLSIMPRNKTNKDDVAAAAACNRAVTDCENWHAAIGALLDSIFWPLTTVEKIFTAAGVPDGDEPRLQYTLRRLEPVQPQLFCFKWTYQSGAKVGVDSFEPFLKLWSLDADGKILYDVTKAEPLDPIRHLVYRGHLLTTYRDNHGGPGRCIMGWIFLRSLGRDWFGRFMERYGQPFVKAKTDKTDVQAVAFLQEAFSMATKIGGIVIGQDDEVELEQALVQGGAEGHKLWHEVCNNAISRAITGNDASSSPAGLNAGESNKSENVREDVRMFDQLILSGTLERQLFAQFLRINGLTGRIKVSFGGLSDEDVQTFAGSLKTMNEAGWEPTDEAIPTINERLGIPMQRKAAPAMDAGIDPQTGLPIPRSAFRVPRSEADDDVATFAARDLKGLLTHFSAGGVPKAKDPTTAVANDHAAELGAAMEDAFAPLVKLIENATSAKDAERKIAAYFADWRPKQFVTALEKPLQVCAAKGAIEGKS